MREFYILRTESDPTILGFRNGIKQASIKRAGFHEPQKYDDIMKFLGSNQYWEFKDKIDGAEFELQCVEMLPKAQLTHFLLFGPHLMHCPFLASERLFSVLSKAKLPYHKAFPAEVMDAKGSYRYYLPYIPPLVGNVIDYSRSTFCSSFDNFKTDTYHFASAEEATAFTKENVGTIGREIYLSEEFDRDLDVFVLDHAGIIISQKFKKSLESAGTTSGSKILPAFGEVPWPVIK